MNLTVELLFGIFGLGVAWLLYANKERADKLGDIDSYANLALFSGNGILGAYNLAVGIRTLLG